jgi:ERCC4-type nuclease
MEPVYVDDREPEDIQEMAYEYFPEYELKHLVSGDIVCGELVIERKTVQDFVSSVIDSRVFRQADMMSDNFKRGYIIIIGTMCDFFKAVKRQGRNTHFTTDNYLGAVESLMRRPHIRVFEVKTKKQFFELTKKIFKKANKRNEPIDNIKRIKPSSDDVHVNQIFMVDGRQREKIGR